MSLSTDDELREMLLDDPESEADTFGFEADTFEVPDVSDLSHEGLQGVEAALDWVKHNHNTLRFGLVPVGRMEVTGRDDLIS